MSRLALLVPRERLFLAPTSTAAGASAADASSVARFELAFLVSVYGQEQVFDGCR